MREPLSAEEYGQVLLATKRESTSFRVWPPDVIKAFASSEVITIHETQRRVESRNLAYFFKQMSSMLRLTRLLSGNEDADNLAVSH